MRSSTVMKNELAHGLRLVGEELASQSSAKLQLTVEGSSRDLHPILRDEVFRIALEALRNAFRHSSAQAIEAEIAYSGGLRVRIRDDGKGIDPATLDEGRPGHYGIPGMRERASRIGGKLRLCSAPGLGTEVELSVPAAVAFGESGASTLLRRFRRKRKSQSAAQC